MLGPVGDADRRPELDLGERRARELADDDLGALLRTASILEHDRELVAADARGERSGRRRPMEQIGGCDEQAVAGGVPVVIVHVAKPVEVDPEQRERRPHGGGQRGQSVIERPAVGEPRQRIVQALELGPIERLGVAARHDERSSRDGGGSERERDRRRVRPPPHRERHRDDQRRQLDARRAEGSVRNDGAEQRRATGGRGASRGRRSGRRGRARRRRTAQPRITPFARLGRAPAEERRDAYRAETDERERRPGQDAPVPDDPRRAADARDQLDDGKSPGCFCSLGPCGPHKSQIGIELNLLPPPNEG